MVPASEPARRVWVLNFDAEAELEHVGKRETRNWPRQHLAAEMARRLQHTLRGLVRADDVILTGAEPTPHAKAAGLCWCSTPSAITTLQNAGVKPVWAPPPAAVAKANARRFVEQLRDRGELGRLPGAGYAETAEAALARLEKPPPDGHRGWIVKRDFGWAGRGQFAYRPGEPSADPNALHAFLKRSFRHGHGVVVEPVLERLAELTIHGIVEVGRPLSLGNPVAQRIRGHGTWAEAHPTRPAEPGEHQSWNVVSSDEMNALHEAACSVARALAAIDYQGPFGLDAIRHPHGLAVMELNARFTMGWPHSGLAATG